MSLSVPFPSEVMTLKSTFAPPQFEWGEETMCEISFHSGLAFVLVLGMSVSSSVTVTGFISHLVHSGTWWNAGSPRAGGCRIDWILLIFSPNPNMGVMADSGSLPCSISPYLLPSQTRERLVLFYFLKK